MTAGVPRETYRGGDRALASVLIGMLPAVAPYGGRVNVRPRAIPACQTGLKGSSRARTRSAGAE